MSKTAVVMLCGLLLVMLGLRYYSSRNAPAPRSAPSASAPAAVDMPVETSQETAQPFPDPASLFGEKKGEQPRPVLPREVERISDCAGGSPEEIIAAHGKKWGYALKAADRGWTKRVYELLSDYYSCRSSVSGNTAECRSLPQVPAEWSKGLNPRNTCEKNSNQMRFYAYMAGKSKDSSGCRGFLSDDSIEGVSVDSFCSKAAGGMENLCASLGSGKLKKCLMGYPSTEADCANDMECLQSYNLYRAVKTGSADYCPPDGSVCRAFLMKEMSMCNTVARNLSVQYCSRMR